MSLRENILVVVENLLGRDRVLVIDLNVSNFSSTSLLAYNSLRFNRGVSFEVVDSISAFDRFVSIDSLNSLHLGLSLRGCLLLLFVSLDQT